MIVMVARLANVVKAGPPGFLEVVVVAAFAGAPQTRFPNTEAAEPDQEQGILMTAQAPGTARKVIALPIPLVALTKCSVQASFSREETVAASAAAEQLNRPNAMLIDSPSPASSGCTGLWIQSMYQPIADTPRASTGGIGPSTRSMCRPTGGMFPSWLDDIGPWIRRGRSSSDAMHPSWTVVVGWRIAASALRSTDVGRMKPYRERSKSRAECKNCARTVRWRAPVSYNMLPCFKAALNILVARIRQLRH